MSNTLSSGMKLDWDMQNYDPSQLYMYDWEIGPTYFHSLYFDDRHHECLMSDVSSLVSETAKFDDITNFYF